MNLAIVTNILTPYRIPLFEAISRQVDRLSVLLMAETEENRDWILEAYRFDADVLPGFHLPIRGRETAVHMNYGVTERLRRLNPDLVLSGGFAPANWGALLYCAKHRKPYLAWGELALRSCAGGSRLRHGLRRLICGLSSGAIASSSEAKHVFMHYGIDEKDILLAPMPIDVDYVNSKVAACRAHPGFRDVKSRYPGPVLLSVARLIDAKGYPQLFDMYAEIVKTRPETTLLVVGDGPERERYVNHIAARGWGNLHLVGHVQWRDLMTYYAIADIVVFPSLADTFGAVIAEGMAAELPVISSIHAAATEDLIEEGKTGFVIDPLDISGSIQTILKVLAMPEEELRRVGREAFLRARNIGIEGSARRMIEFFHSKVKPGASRAIRHR